MTRLLAALALAASLVPRPSLPTPVQPGPPEVAIDFVASDRKGVPVLDLKAEEVEVWIGHFRVPIPAFSAVTPGADERAGRLIVLLLDDMTSPLALIPRVKDV